MSELQPVRGARDFYPDEMRLRNWLFHHFRAVAQQFGFAEYDAPVLESEALYTRKAGEEIVEQLYTFADKGGRRVALRPEMTPSLARMVLARANALPLPLKWFSVPQCWRYERMTRGRKREHYQWNMDILGVADMAAEVELLAALAALLVRLGLGPDDVGLRVSSRKALQAVLTRAGVADEQFAPVCVTVDKLDRQPRETVEGELAALGLDAATIASVIATLELRSLDDLARALGGDHPAVAELRRLWVLADGYGLGDWLVFDASIVRGLAYYTGVVFEAFDRGATLRAICGGGRYDHLLSTFGGDDLPACGFGFGDVVILELLADRGRLPTLGAGIDDVVFAFDDKLRSAAIDIAQRLRQAGRAVDLVLEPRKLKWAFKHADRAGARRMVLIAPQEWAQGKVRVRDLRSGAERDVPVAEL